MVQHPNLRAFLQGYLVHCLTDEIDLESMLYRRFPFNLLKGKLSSKQVAALLELFYLESVTLEKKLSGGYNVILQDLGIDEAHVETFVQAATQYLSSPSLASGISLAQQLGMLDDNRVAQYLTAAEQFQKRWIQKKVLLFSLRAGKISKQIVASVRDKLDIWEKSFELNQPDC